MRSQPGTVYLLWFDPEKPCLFGRQGSRHGQSRHKVLLVLLSKTLQIYNRDALTVDKLTLTCRKFITCAFQPGTLKLSWVLNVCGGRFHGFSPTSFEVKSGCIEMLGGSSFLCQSIQKEMNQKNSWLA